MLTSFFGNSRPINLLILVGFLVLAYFFGGVFGSDEVLTMDNILSHFGLLVVSMLSLLLLDFIVKKNKLTNLNSFAAFFFTFFFAMLPFVFRHPDILLANFFLLLALRRIMSLRSDINSKKKILDASLWITIASLFYFWSLLLLLVLWVAIIKKPNADYKQMLVPFTGITAIVLIYSAFKILTDGSFAWLYRWQQPVTMDFSSYHSPQVFVPVTVILAFLIYTGLHRIYKISTLPLSSRPNYRLLLYVCATFLLISLAGPSKTGAELLFLAAPVAILSANYVENFDAERPGKIDKTELWFKEILLWFVVVLSLVFTFT